MKVAISVDGEEVSMHFGRCEGYVIFEEEEGELKSQEKIANPGHQPFFLPKFLAEKGVTQMICNGIGPRAIGEFERLGVEVISGIEGKIDDVIERYLKGELKSAGSTCNHFH